MPSIERILFNLAVPGNIYTHIANPTTDVLEKRVAELEKGIAVGGECGQCRDHLTHPDACGAGNNIVTVPQLYGGTYTLFRHMFSQSGGSRSGLRRRRRSPWPR